MGDSSRAEDDSGQAEPAGRFARWRARRRQHLLDSRDQRGISDDVRADAVHLEGTNPNPPGRGF